MELACSFLFVDDNDNLDPTFQKQDHNDVLEVKEISEFGLVWGKDDTKLLNSHTYILNGVNWMPVQQKTRCGPPTFLSLDFRVGAQLRLTVLSTSTKS
jgi:hypothetical protein